MDNLDPALAEHAELINSLKPLLKNHDFNSIFTELTPDLTRPQRFLVKMELTRLSAPCTRRIDLRGHVNGYCREYQHNGITHFMDSTAIELFEQGIETYGHYSVGVYEQVHNAENNHRVMHKQEQQQRLQEANPNKPVVPAQKDENLKLTKTVLFGDRGPRKEERMNYSMPVDIEIDLNKSIQAVTTDLSVSGCRLKVLKPVEFELGQIFYLQLTGLEREFALGLKDKIQYQVTKIEEKNDFYYLSCERLKDQQNTQSFDNFLHKFINGNKRRYKLNLDNTIEAIINKGYEQYYLPRICSLPVFINANEQGKLTAKFALLNDNNIDVWRQWHDEHNQNCLSQLLSHRRLKTLLNKPGRVKEAVIYAFTHIYKGKVHFYSASDAELEASSALKSLFFGFASHKNNWMTYKVQIIDIKPQLAQLAQTLPNDKAPKITSVKLHKQIQDLKYIALLTDLSNEESKYWYQQNPYDLEQVNQLNQFKHDKTERFTPIKGIAIRYVNLRKEARFNYKTQVSIHFAKKQYDGMTQNFSTEGLQVELSTAIPLEASNKVQLDFPTLQLKGKQQLTNLEYEVVDINKNKTLINLKIYQDSHKKHKAKRFFESLISQNRETLIPDDESSLIPELAEALRNICIQRIVNTGYFIHKDGVKYELKTVGFSQLPNPVVNLLSYQANTDMLNLQPILQHNLFNTLMVDMLRSIQRNDKPKYRDIFIRVKLYEKETDKRFTTIPYNSFRDNDAKYNFIKQSCQNSTVFFALRIFLSRTGRPDTDFIANELLYISQYAIHKAKLLEEELWSVEGVGDIIDISEEVMLRFHFPKHKSEQQIQLKHQLAHHEE